MKKTFIEFLNEVASVTNIHEGADISNGFTFSTHWLQKFADQEAEDLALNQTHKPNERLENLFIGVFWRAGGVSGGDCFHGEPAVYTSDAKPIDITPILMDVIIAVAGNLSIHAYRHRILPLINHDLTSDGGDTYGNVDNYVCVSVNLKKLYETLGFQA